MSGTWSAACGASAEWWRSTAELAGFFGGGFKDKAVRCVWCRRATRLSQCFLIHIGGDPSFGVCDPCGIQLFGVNSPFQPGLDPVDDLGWTLPNH